MRSALAAFATLLVAASTSACATTTLPSPGTAGTKQPGTYPVRVEWAEGDAAGVVFVGDANVCRVPCTVWLTLDERARVVQESPRSAVVPLPHIPGLDTYDEAPRILVRPARGHPGAAVALGVTGGLLSALFVPLAVLACNHPNQGVDSGSAQAFCIEASLAAGISVLVFASGLLLGVNSAWPSADVAPSRARTPSVHLRFSPGGLVGVF